MRRMIWEVTSSHVLYGMSTNLVTKRVISCIYEVWSDLFIGIWGVPHWFRADMYWIDKLASRVGCSHTQVVLDRLRDELRRIPATCKARHDAAADLIHIYAFTRNFFVTEVCDWPSSIR